MADRPNRLLMWIKANFVVNDLDITHMQASKEELDCMFMCMRDGKILRIYFQPDKETNKNMMKIHTDCMELAGSLIQDIAIFFDITDLDSFAHFPDDFQVLQQSLDKANK